MAALVAGRLRVCAEVWVCLGLAVEALLVVAWWRRGVCANGVVRHGLEVRIEAVAVRVVSVTAVGFEAVVAD